jgi:hypothetical protein
MKIAEAMADVLDCEVKEPGDFEEVEGFNLIGFGSGIYYRSFHEEVFQLVDRIGSGTKSFIFSTSGLPNLPVLHDFEGELKSNLEENGFEVIGSFNCRGYDDFGPLRYIGGIHGGRPDKEDLRNARKFVEDEILPEF